MIQRHTVLQAALAGVLAFGLAGCATQSSAPAPAMSSVVVYTATLTPGEEVPPAAESKGSGTAEVRIDTKTNELTWKVTVNDLTGPATAGHIHGPAGKGSNAGVVVPFAGVPNTTSSEGKGSITQAQFGDLAAGLYYVNVHTAKYPGGEVRGQLMKK